MLISGVSLMLLMRHLDAAMPFLYLSVGRHLIDIITFDITISSLHFPDLLLVILISQRSMEETPIIELGLIKVAMRCCLFEIFLDTIVKHGRRFIIKP